MRITDGFGIGLENYPSFYGGGLSFSDFNQDGLDDITVGTDRNWEIHFYWHNQGQSYTKLPSIVDCDCHQKQILGVDIDNDHNNDLYKFMNHYT